MKTLTTFALLLCLPLVAIADDKKKQNLYEKKDDRERVYFVPYDRLWSASIAAAKEEFSIADTNEKDGYFSFESGAGFTSTGFSVSVALIKVEDGKTRIKLSLQKKSSKFAWGAGGRVTDKFFKTLDRILTEK